MNIHGYTSTGMISISIDGVNILVPDEMSNRHRQEIAKWESQGNTIPSYVPSEQQVLIQPPENYAQNRFELEDGEVSIVDGSPGFAGGFILEEGQIHVFFVEEVNQPYSIYFDMAEPVFCYVKPEEKYSFGFIVRAVNLVGGAPVTPTCIGIKVER